jgi:nitroimidazol reductase NimA-like FMN-containing flavoprotein (pyridoxamine 5'-phosphate oxidase superfamily)
MRERHPMRRADRQVTDPDAIGAVLDAGEVLYLAMTDEGAPYVVPLNYGWDGSNVWVHCAEEGLKLDILARDPRVSFAVASEARVVPGKGCGWTTKFRSVVGFGAAVLVTGEEERLKGLAAVVSHYSHASESITSRQAKGCAVVRIDVESMTGKVRE